MTTDERLAALERSNRRLRLTVLAMVCGATCLAVGGAARQNAVDDLIVRKFTLIDDEGKICAAMVAEKGVGKLRLFVQGQPYLNVGHSGKTGLLLLSNGGKSQAQLVAAADGATVGVDDTEG